MTMDNELKEKLEFLAQEMMVKKETIARLKFELKNEETAKDVIEKELINLLNENKTKEYRNHIYRFGFVEKSRTAFDQKLFQNAHPDLYDKYKVEKRSEVFEFKLV